MIENYQFGQIIIDGQMFDRDIYITSSDKVKTWWRQESHFINKNDIEEALVEKPKILIIGTGAYGVAKVSDQAKNLIQENGIELIILPTTEATKKYNQAKQTNQSVVAYLHLTC